MIFHGSGDLKAMSVGLTDKYDFTLK